MKVFQPLTLFRLALQLFRLGCNQRTVNDRPFSNLGVHDAPTPSWRVGVHPRCVTALLLERCAPWPRFRAAHNFSVTTRAPRLLVRFLVHLMIFKDIISYFAVIVCRRTVGAEEDKFPNHAARGDFLPSPSPLPFVPSPVQYDIILAPPLLSNETDFLGFPLARPRNMAWIDGVN